eukprot:GHVU01140609.1.p1 GENE.GHVU01140609.1~~GHVU01140609.1.p1  ORF type:complete len:146 (-),score=13.07 GHVU01140609.1:34-471(-)
MFSSVVPVQYDDDDDKRWSQPASQPGSPSPSAVCVRSAVGDALYLSLWARAHVCVCVRTCFVVVVSFSGLRLPSPRGRGKPNCQMRLSAVCGEAEGDSRLEQADLVQSQVQRGRRPRGPPDRPPPRGRGRLLLTREKPTDRQIDR